MKKILLMLVFILYIVCPATAQTVVTYWNANPPEDEVLYYNVYYGEDCLSLDKQANTTECHCVFRDFLLGGTYFFAVTATNMAGESTLSEIVGVTLKLESSCLGDLNKDGTVNNSDLVIFAADFGRTNCIEKK